MSYRTLLISAALAAATSGLAGVAQADILAVDSGLAVKESDSTPSRGMTMSQVAAKFGAPGSKVPAVGTPPISRWEYPGFVVYFEGDHVIHSVVSESSAAPATAPATAPMAEAAAADPSPSE
jgi:hypothetical protein